MKNVLEGEIQAIVPIYGKSGGNFTQVKLLTGDYLIKKSIKSVMRSICKYYHYDLKSSNEKYGSMLGIKKMPPIPFTRDLVLIAVKTRCPIGKDDGAYSYINVEQVERVKDKVVYFKDGSSLNTLLEDKTVLKTLNITKMLYTRPEDRRGMLAESPDVYNIRLEDERAIKEDVFDLCKKISRIKKYF